MKEKIIYITHRIPYPPNKGDKIRSFNILLALSEKYDVYLGTFIDDLNDEIYITKVKELCADFFCLKLTRCEKIASAAQSFIQNKSISESVYYNKKMKEWILNTSAQEKIKKILAFSSPMGQYLVDQDDYSHRIVDIVDVDSYKWYEYSLKTNYFKKWIYLREAHLLQKLEKLIAIKATATTLVTHDELNLFKKITKINQKVFTIQNGVDYNYFDSRHELLNPYLDNKFKIIFTGRMDYWPNVQAVLWFAKNILPNLKQHQNIQFYIVGAEPNAKVRALESNKKITVTGSVADIRPYLKYANFAVAPLLIGRGIQNKVLEAMSMNTAIIASPEALTGIDLNHETSVYQATSRNDWINLINENIYKQKKVYHRNFVIENFCWNKNLRLLTNLLD